MLNLLKSNFQERIWNYTKIRENCTFNTLSAFLMDNLLISGTTPHVVLIKTHTKIIEMNYICDLILKP